MQKVLEQINVELTEVVSDITGVTGMSIIGAILEGERDPVKLAQLRIKTPSIQRGSDCPGVARHGRRNLFELRRLISPTSSIIGRSPSATSRSKPNWPISPTERERRRTLSSRGSAGKSNDVRFEATGPLFQALGVDLTLIDGIDVATALVILGEIGVDVSRFPTEKHFASWLRLCPPQDESNQTKKRRGHRKGTNRVTFALRMCAQSLGRTMTPLGLFYRRIRSRIGGRGAVKATGQVGVFGLPDAQVRPGVCHAVDRRVRGQGEGQGVESASGRPAAMGFQLSPLPTQ